MKFDSSFQMIPFPESPEIVYVISFKSGSDLFPFYVGQTTRNVGRIGDYVSAQFSASTDFRVGRTVRLLKQRGYQVWVAYKPSTSRNEEERALKRKFIDMGFKQLDELPGYDYRTSIEEQELNRLKDFVETLVAGKSASS